LLSRRVFRAGCPYGAGTFTAQNGTIAIPSAGGSYANSVTCEYRITTGAPIYLRFESFATESGFDYVEVYDGTSSSGSLKGKFSGTVIPAIQTATSGSMFIRFTSDSGNVAAGVSMTWLDTMPATASPTRSPTPSPTLSPTRVPTFNGIPHARADAHRCRWDTMPVHMYGYACNSC
jgi:hypothetical protein